MPSNNITLQQSMVWAQYFVGLRPLALNLNEPALTSANIIIQTILQPPFRWNWNRNRSSFSITQAAQTYSISLPDFGFIEKAYVNDVTGKVYEIPSIKQELTQDSGTGRPTSIAPVNDDNNGNILFQIFPAIVDQPYTMNIIYQKQVPLMSTSSSVWPIPDRYGLIYQQGFLGMMMVFAEKTDVGVLMLQRFAASLLAVSEGLTEQERNAFLDSWNITVDSQRALAKLGQGFSARAGR